MTQNPMVEPATENKSYINTTRDILTASKIKLAVMNLKAYNEVYNNTPEDVAELYEDKKEDHFQFGTMAHKLLEMFNEKNMTLEAIIDGFLQDYDITNRYLKDDYKEMIIKQKYASWEIDNTTDEQARRKLLSKQEYTLEKLRETYYGADGYAKLKQKTPITRAEARKLIVWESWDPRIADSVLKVAVMNKDRDMWGKYSTEERIEAKYKGKILGAKPDRIVFRSNKTPEHRRTIQEMDKLMEWLTREQRVTMVKNQEIRCLIRDYKTEGQAIELYNGIQRYWDSKYGYIFSMAFYYLIVWIKYAVESQVTLDVIEKTEPFFSYALSIPEDIMKDKIHKITQTMDKIIEAEKTGNRGTLTVEDIFQNPDIKKYYPIIGKTIDSSQVFLDLSM